MIADYIYNNESTIRLSIFLSAFIVLALSEWMWPKRELTQDKTRRWLNNFGLIVSSTLLVRVLVPLAAVGAAYFAEQEHLGFANHFELPAWIEFIIIVLLLDLSIYIQHTLFHVMPVFWRFHRVHHSDMDCDVSTGVRFHPVEILISIILKIIFILLLGAPVLAVILFEIVLNFMSMFTHSNVRINETIERVIRWFFVTPDMHRVHHSTRENETNSNFGFHLSVWDRIFGTYKAEPEAGHQGMFIGLDQFREPTCQTFKSLIGMPFYGHVRGYAINYRDTVNARELAQAKEIADKNKEKAKLAQVLDSYLQAIGQLALVSVADVHGKITEVNDKFCEVSGYSRKELIGQDHRIVNSGVHDKSFFTKMWDTIRSGNKWYGEVCNRTKDGELYWVESTIVPIKNAEGKIDLYISVRVDITRRKNYEAGMEQINKELITSNIELENLSRIDGLTGVVNRRYFDEKLANHISIMSRSDTTLTLMLCDIDYFKNYNDQYGHQAGDSCLQQVAKAIGENFTRTGDVVARYGGEEFAVVLPNVGEVTAIMLAERLRASVELLKVEHGGSSVSEVVTVSVGLVTVVPDKDTTSSDLIEKADQALYQAKGAGRNRVRVAE